MKQKTRSFNRSVKQNGKYEPGFVRDKIGLLTFYRESPTALGNKLQLNKKREKN